MGGLEGAPDGLTSSTRALAKSVILGKAMERLSSKSCDHKSICMSMLSLAVDSRFSNSRMAEFTSEASFCRCTEWSRSENGDSVGFSNARSAIVRSNSSWMRSFVSPYSQRWFCANCSASSSLPSRISSISCCCY